MVIGWRDKSEVGKKGSDVSRERFRSDYWKIEVLMVYIQRTISELSRFLKVATSFHCCL